MKAALSLSLFLALPAFSQSYMGTFMTTGVSAGLSYRNPSVGGGARAVCFLSRFTMAETVSYTWQPKTFEPSGTILNTKSDLSVRLGPIEGIATALSSRQQNPQFSKTAVLPGAGIGIRRSTWELQAYYARDVLSVNHLQKFGGEVWAHTQQRWGVLMGVSGGLIVFTQPFGPSPATGLRGTEFTLHLGMHRYIGGSGR